MNTTKHLTYCRICQASCGLTVELADDRTIRSVRGDIDDPLSRGFTCPKGRRSAELHQGPGRLLQTLRRNRDGSFEPVDVEAAMDEIAERLAPLIAEEGPGAVGLFLGTQSFFAALTAPVARAWMRSVRSPKLFTTMTIDQSAKWVADGRLGMWLGGRQSFQDADVWLLLGTNPLISMQGGSLTGFPANDPGARLAAAQERGLELIVIDPRRTETATRADLHLQPLPGTDAVLLASILNVVLAEGLHDAEFCERYVDGLDTLRRAVEPVTPEVAARAADVDPALIVQAARTFGGARRGMAAGGTGPDMARHSNLAEHLIQCLNVVCGRYAREGELSPHTAVLSRRPPARAQVLPPGRGWERGYRSRIGGAGHIYGELPTAILPDEVLEPGPDRLRALFVAGGNPLMAIPEPAQTARALRALDLLVVIDPFLSETAQLADFVIAPAMAFERPDHTGSTEALFSEPYARATDALLERPPHVIEDWELFWGLAARMGVDLKLKGTPIDMETRPSSAELLAILADGPVPLDEVRQHPHGKVFDHDGSVVLPPAEDAAGGRFDLLPDDVADELAAARAELDPRPDGFTHLLTVRRDRHLMNSLGRAVPGLPRQPYSPAHLHPADLDALGLEDRDPILVRSRHGELRAIAHADPTLRRGVVSMTHCWETSTDAGVSLDAPGGTGQLLSIRSDSQSINRMPLLSSVPVRIEAAP